MNIKEKRSSYFSVSSIKTHKSKSLNLFGKVSESLIFMFFFFFDFYSKVEDNS